MMRGVLFPLFLLGALALFAVPALGQTCGDSACDASENAQSCPADCPAQCGDGFCTHSEDATTCSQDCRPADPCAGVSCSPSTATCPDGFTASCQNSCSGGQCSACTPDCSGHLCGNKVCDPSESSSTCPGDCPASPVCGNSRCEPSETSQSCPSDCGQSFCGDQKCESPETAASCSSDCPASCGDSFCTHSETSLSCPVDCSSGAACGNAKCELGETSQSCPSDCKQGFCGDGFCSFPEDSTACPQDCGSTGPLCGNQRCEQGESPQSCPSDCFGGGTCGNNQCELGETTQTCPSDCRQGFCGNQVCDPGEGSFFCPQDCPGGACGNGVCDPSESDQSCPADCPPPFCGDGRCQPAEDPFLCPRDCQSGSACGNGLCDNGETSQFCPSDCPAAICGNGACDQGEHPGNCQQDCGSTCPDGYQPVCGKDGTTYSNSCFASLAQAPIACSGPCPCGALACPQQISCPDGSTVACSQQGNRCDCKCPLPPACQQVTDPNTGFTSVSCQGPGQPCPPIPPDASQRCTASEGRPAHSTDPRGCGILTCIFDGGKPPSFFGGRDCPDPAAIQQRLNSCSGLGMDGIVVDEAGCKIGKCVPKREFCEEEQDRNKRNEKIVGCRKQGQGYRTDFDEKGCKVIVCEQERACERALPAEAYERCDREGGEMVVNTDQSGCISFMDCVRRGSSDDVRVERVEEVPDSTTLLNIAFKLEELIQELDKLSRKADSLADYYASVGSSDEKRFRRIASMFQDAKDEVNDIKDGLRQSLDRLQTHDIEEVKRRLLHLKEVTLRDIGFVMLSSSEDAERQFEDEQEFETDEFEEFNQAFVVCAPASFRPEPEVLISLEGIDSEGKCVMKAKVDEGPPGVDISMECHIKDFSKGLSSVGPDGPTAQTMDEWECTGTMADGIRSGQFGPRNGGGSVIPPEAQDIMDQLNCFDQASCGRACQDSQNWQLCQRLGQLMGGGRPSQGPPPGQFDPNQPPNQFGPNPPLPPNQFGPGPSSGPGSGGGGQQACVGCLNNGVCDQGECSGCPDCLSGGGGP